MKARQVKKQSKAIDKTLAHIERLLELQREVDEAKRFEGDLIMLLSGYPEHHCVSYGDDNCRNICLVNVQNLLRENKELKEQLARNLQNKQ